MEKISLQPENAALPEGSRADENATKKSKHKEWASQRQNKERDQIGEMFLDRMKADPDSPRPSGGDDAPQGVGSSEGSRPSSSPVSPGTKLQAVDGLLLPASAYCGSGRAMQNDDDVTDRIFAPTAPRFCHREGEADYNDIWREFPKEEWHVSYQEFDTDNITVKQHGEEVSHYLKRFNGKCAALEITPTRNRAGLDKFYEVLPFIPRNLEATTRNSI